MDAYDLHSGNGNNLSGYANAQIDGIIGALAVSADPAERVRLLGEAAPVLWTRYADAAVCTASSARC